MAMSPRLELRQGQALVMTPQLQQAIKLLQLSNIELTEFVEAELERNPLLEREENQAEAKPEKSAETQALDFDADAQSEPALDVEVADMAPDLSRSDLAEAGAAPLTDWSKASPARASTICRGSRRRSPATRLSPNTSISSSRKRAFRRWSA
jgi:RNA polymerase sigma-54 factor